MVWSTDGDAFKALFFGRLQLMGNTVVLVLPERIQFDFSNKYS